MCARLSAYYMSSNVTDPVSVLVHFSTDFYEILKMMPKHLYFHQKKIRNLICRYLFSTNPNESASNVFSVVMIKEPFSYTVGS